MTPVKTNLSLSVSFFRVQLYVCADRCMRDTDSLLSIENKHLICLACF